MDDYALPNFKKGHLAVVGEWLAWPVVGKIIFLTLDSIPSLNAG